MKVEFKGKYLVVTKEPGDPTFHSGGWGSAESRLLYHIKNKLIKQGYDVIKKPMWKDGHMVSETQQYIRSRNMKKGDSFMIWDDQYVVRNAAIDFNDGKVEYRWELNTADNPKILKKKRPARAITPVRVSTGSKVPPFQPGLGDKLMKRFNPDQTGTIMSVLDHGTIVGLKLRKSDGTSFFINMDHRMFHHFAGDYDYRLIGVKVSYDGEQIYPVDTNPIAGRNPASRAKGHHCIDCGRYLKYGIPVDFYGQKAYKCVGCYYAGPVLSKMKPRLTNPSKDRRLVKTIFQEVTSGPPKRWWRIVSVDVSDFPGGGVFYSVEVRTQGSREWVQLDKSQEVEQAKDLLHAWKGKVT